MIKKENIHVFLKRFCSSIRLRIILLVLCVLAASVCYSCRRNDGVELKLEKTDTAENPEENTTASGELSAGSTDQEIAETSQSSRSMIYVHICGQVKSPGVYQVPEGSRIFEVLNLAGGYTDSAAEEYLNLADSVSDGQKLVVPSVTELKEDELYGVSELQNSEQSKVNLNTATREELMTLHGIGESKAEDILQYRSTHGAFKRIEDIKQIPGIKDAAFEKIKDSITV